MNATKIDSGFDDDTNPSDVAAFDAARADKPTGYAKVLQAERVKAQEADEEWLVKKPGEHSNTHYRVVRDCGINAVGGKGVFAAICEISTSRSSEDNFSDATERARAEAIARDHNEHAALVAVAEAAKWFNDILSTAKDGGDLWCSIRNRPGTEKIVKQLSDGIKSLTDVRAGKVAK